VDTNEIVVAFASSLAGAVVGAVLPLFLPNKSKNAGPKNSISGGKFADSDVHVGDIQVTTDNRIVVNTTVVRDVINATPAPERRDRATGHETGTSEDWWVTPALIIIGILLVLVGYIRYRDTVNVVALALSGFAMFFPLGALVVARSRSVAFGRRQLVQTWINTGMALTSLWGLYLLNNPMFGIDQQAFERLIAVGRDASVIGLFREFGPDWAPFLAYQLGGLVLLVIACAAIAFHSLKTYAIAAAAVRASTNAAYQPGPIRSWLIRTGGAPGHVFSSAIVVLCVAFVLLSGAGYALVKKMEGNVEFPTTVTTPTEPAPVPQSAAQTAAPSS
jgi:hypothetical protein